MTRSRAWNKNMNKFEEKYLKKKWEQGLKIKQTECVQDLDIDLEKKTANPR